ncbi:hypothetical protein NQ318_014056 [Aromia moschata]|uniref:SAM domain-containing protein n=1 Tax=Aromia moschata TaxID=1265417 RepID=A0AAV8Z0X0_9CUCU|nr:hypothetical protein NQ318_014056 [Aromia moschata]
MPPPPSGGLTRSISQPNFMQELQRNGDANLHQEPPSIFVRPGMGSIVIRKSITNTFGGFYANHGGQEGSSIGSGESYGARPTTDDELSGVCRYDLQRGRRSKRSPGEILDSFRIGRIPAQVQEQKIDLDTLVILTENDLKSLNLPLGPYRKLVNAISERRAALENPGEVTDSML